MWLKNLGNAVFAIRGIAIITLAGLPMVSCGVASGDTAQTDPTAKVDGTTMTTSVPPPLGDLPAATASTGGEQSADANAYVDFVAKFSATQSRGGSAYTKMTQVYRDVPAELATLAPAERTKLVNEWTASIQAITGPAIAELKAIETPKVGAALQSQVASTSNGRDRIIRQLTEHDEAIKRLGALVMACTPANNEETFEAIELEVHAHRGNNFRSIAFTNFNLAAGLAESSPGRGILAAHAYFNDSISAIFDVLAKRLTSDQASQKIEGQVARLRASVLAGRATVKARVDEVNAELARPATTAQTRSSMQPLLEIYGDYSLSMDELDQAADLAAQMVPLVRKNDPQSWEGIRSLVQQASTLQGHSMKVVNGAAAKLAKLPD